MYSSSSSSTRKYCLFFLLFAITIGWAANCWDSNNCCIAQPGRAGCNSTCITICVCQFYAIPSCCSNTTGWTNACVTAAQIMGPACYYPSLPLPPSNCTNSRCTASCQQQYTNTTPTTVQPTTSIPNTPTTTTISPTTTTTNNTTTTTTISPTTTTNTPEATTTTTTNNTNTPETTTTTATTSSSSSTTPDTTTPSETTQPTTDTTSTSTTSSTTESTDNNTTLPSSSDIPSDTTTTAIVTTTGIIITTTSDNAIHSSDEDSTNNNEIILSVVIVVIIVFYCFCIVIFAIFRKRIFNKIRGRNIIFTNGGNNHLPNITELEITRQKSTAAYTPVDSKKIQQQATNTHVDIEDDDNEDKPTKEIVSTSTSEHPVYLEIDDYTHNNNENPNTYIPKGGITGLDDTAFKELQDKLDSINKQSRNKKEEDEKNNLVTGVKNNKKKKHRENKNVSIIEFPSSSTTTTNQ